MEQRRLGATGVDVSRVILGCGNFGGVGSAPAFFGQGENEEEAFAIMDAAWERGVRAFDTADAYGGGRSEAWIGLWQAVRGPRPVLATKVFNSVVGDPDDRGLARDRILRQIDGSLERLGVERVDLYLIHAPDPDTPLEETLGTFAELVRTGKVGAIGASNVDRAYLEDALAISEREGFPRFEWVQNSYSLLDREAEAGVLPFCRGARARLHAVQPARWRLADREVRAGRRVPRGLAYDTAAGALRRLRRRAGLARARAAGCRRAGAGRRHGDARVRLAARESRRDRRGRRPASPRTPRARGAGARTGPVAGRARRARGVLLMELRTPEELLAIGFSRSRVVMVNEAHDGMKRCVRTREIGLRLLPAAHAAGVRHLAMEALYGPYLAQPDLARLVEAAEELGWRLIPYEVTSHMTTNEREEEQARNLAVALSQLPQEAPLLVWCGNGHLTKEPRDWWRPMGYQFWEHSGIEPFAIDQTVTVEFDPDTSGAWHRLGLEQTRRLETLGGTAGFLVADSPISRPGVDAVLLSTQNALE